MQINLNISNVVNNKQCCSCGACFAVCNHDAISYQETVGGNLFPVIDRSLCVDCSLCYRVCPGTHFGVTLNRQLPQDPFVGNTTNAFVGKSNDKEIFRNSQSGGIVTSLLAFLLETNQIDAAVVAIMKSGMPPRGDVIIAKNRYELINAQKSKYTPIPILKVIKEIRSIQTKVAFVGLPCHMHGLYNLIDLYPELKDKVICKIGLICESIMTTAAIDFLSEKTKCKDVINIIFKDKNRNSYPGNVIIQSSTGKDVILNKKNRIAIKNFFTPARCTICFDKMNVFSDITVGDPHGIHNVDRVNGESLVITRSTVGDCLVESLICSKRVSLRCIDPKSAISGQNIQKKKMFWKKHIDAWEKTGNMFPEYFSRLHSINISNKKNRQTLLKNALKLDDFENRNSLLVYFKQKLFYQNIKNLFNPIRIIRSTIYKLKLSAKRF